MLLHVQGVALRLTECQHLQLQQVLVGLLHRELGAPIGSRAWHRGRARRSAAGGRRLRPLRGVLTACKVARRDTDAAARVVHGCVQGRAELLVCAETAFEALCGHGLLRRLAGLFRGGHSACVAARAGVLRRERRAGLLCSISCGMLQFHRCRCRLCCVSRLGLCCVGSGAADGFPQPSGEGISRVEATPVAAAGTFVLALLLCLARPVHEGPAVVLYRRLPAHGRHLAKLYADNEVLVAAGHEGGVALQALCSPQEWPQGGAVRVLGDEGAVRVCEGSNDAGCRRDRMRRRQCWRWRLHWCCAESACSTCS
mmetsp:Transcript_84276/g.272788  ORF Transcript_84276/g.272788 Transcript_84276/m.272788 type:complete len:312 (-) Transcript_84276:649-1584(-)